MMWCYRYNLHGISNLRDLRIEDYFNNTFLLKCLLKGLLSYEHCKSNKGVLFNQVICRKNFLISLLVSVMQIMNDFHL